MQKVMLYIFVEIAVGHRNHNGVFPIWKHGQLKYKLTREFLPLLYGAWSHVSERQRIFPKQILPKSISNNKTKYWVIQCFVCPCMNDHADFFAANEYAVWTRRQFL